MFRPNTTILFTYHTVSLNLILYIHCSNLKKPNICTSTDFIPKAISVKYSQSMTTFGVFLSILVNSLVVAALVRTCC
jgi:ABC-type maltose transport system permease subunit